MIMLLWERCASFCMCERDSAGLVGPIRESAPLMTESLPECEAGCDVGGLGDMVDFVRQWAQVRLALGGELGDACLPAGSRIAANGVYMRADS